MQLTLVDSNSVLNGTANQVLPLSIESPILAQLIEENPQNSSFEHEFRPET
jgi:hypothetical protein